MYNGKREETRRRRAGAARQVGAEASGYARLQSRQGADSRAVASSQRDLGSEAASPATAAAARQRDSPAGAAVAQPDGAGTSRAGAAAVAGRGTASQAAASSFPAAGRRAPTADIAAAKRLGRRLAEVAEATAAAPEAPLILSQKEKEAGLPVSQRQRQRQCCSRRAYWRQRQERWQRTMCVGGKLGKATHLRRVMGRCATFFFAGYEGGPRGLHGAPLIPSQPAHTTNTPIKFPPRCRRAQPATRASICCTWVCVLQRGALITCPARLRHLQHSAMSTVCWSRGVSPPLLEHISGSELKNCIDNQETQSLNSFRLSKFSSSCPVC